MATEPNQTAIEIPVDLFIAAAPSLAVPVAGLLADKPELAEASKTPDAWQKALDAYLKSPRS